MSGRKFYEQNMPLWVLEWARSHDLSAREAVDYAQRRVPKLPHYPRHFMKVPGLALGQSPDTSTPGRLSRRAQDI
jgi:hypothetical protein